MNHAFLALKDKINRKRINISIVGLGYVGLPLALAFAKKGIRVCGIDIDKGRLANIAAKESYISDVPARELKNVLSRGKFRACGDFNSLKDADVIIICVPTPLKGKYLPNISYIKQAVVSISKNFRKGSLIILESTTYPGTTEEVILPLLEKNGLKHNRDFFLSFSPERIDPGNKSFPVHKIPKVVGGVSAEATRLTELVYRHIIENIHPVSCARAAEAVKLLENTFRLINIALIDELAMMAHKMSINIWEVVAAAKTKPFGFMPFYPGPGVGGHCIPKDPLYLFWKAKHFGFNSRFIKLASDIINTMPEYVVTRLEEELKKRGILLDKARILVLGAAYKRDIKDLRKSPSLDIIYVLKAKKAKVDYFDPLVPYLRFKDINLKSIDLRRINLSKFDGIILATDHSSVNYGDILNKAKLIFDTRHVYKENQSRKVVFL